MVGMSRLKSSNTAGHGQVVALSRRCLDEASVLVWQVPFPHCWLSGHRTAVVLCPWKPAGVRFGWEEEPSTHCVVPRVDAKYPDCSKHEAWNSQGTFLPLLLSGPSPPHVTQGAAPHRPPTVLLQALQGHRPVTSGCQHHVWVESQCGDMFTGNLRA